MTAATETAKNALKAQLFQNFSWGMAARVYYMVTRFLLTPVTLAYVTLDEYGIWAACFILIGYMGMSSMGIANVYVRYVAEYNAKNEQEKINKLVSTGLVVTGAITVIMIGGLLLFLPWVVHLLKIPAPLTRTATVLVVATAVSFMIDLTFGVYSNILTGLQRIAENNVIWVVTVTLEVAVTVILLRRGHGIYSLAWSFGARYLLALVLKTWYCYRLMPSLSVSLRNFDRTYLRLFFGYGSIVQLNGLASIFLYSIEKVIAGMFVGVRATGLFDVGEKLPVMGSQLSDSMTGIFMPALSHMNTLTWKSELIKLYIKGARYMNMMTGTLLGFMAAFAYPLLHLWIGPAKQFEAAVPILMIFCFPYQINALTGPGSAYHRGVAHPGREMVYPASQFILVVLFVVCGFFYYGRTAMVIAVADATAMVLSALIYIAYTNRVMQVPQGMFFRQAFLPGLIPYAIGFATAWTCSPIFVWAGTSRIRLAAGLSLCVIGYLVLVAGALYRGFCPWGEREYLRKQVQHTFSGVLGRQAAG